MRRDVTRALGGAAVPGRPAGPRPSRAIAYRCLAGRLRKRDVTYVRASTRYMCTYMHFRGEMVNVVWVELLLVSVYGLTLLKVYIGLYSITDLLFFCGLSQADFEPQNVMVFCSSTVSCGGGDDIGLMTARECCVENPNGLAYRRANSSCSPCIGTYACNSLIERKLSSCHTSLLNNSLWVFSRSLHWSRRIGPHSRSGFSEGCCASWP